MEYIFYFFCQQVKISLLWCLVGGGGGGAGGYLIHSFDFGFGICHPCKYQGKLLLAAITVSYHGHFRLWAHNMLPFSLTVVSGCM